MCSDCEVQQAGIWWERHRVKMNPASVQKTSAFIDTLRPGGGTYYKPRLQQCYALFAARGIPGNLKLDVLLLINRISHACYMELLT